MHRNGWARSIEDKDSTFSQSFDVSQTAAHRCSPSPVCECVWSAPMAAKLGGTEKGALLKLLSPVTKEQDAATRLRRSPWPVNPYKPSVPPPLAVCGLRRWGI